MVLKLSVNSKGFLKTKLNTRLSHKLEVSYSANIVLNKSIGDVPGRVRVSTDTLPLTGCAECILL